MKIGIYHIFEANRRALIKELDNSHDFEFEAIDDWTKLTSTTSELIVLFSPGFLPTQVSIEQLKSVLQELGKTLVIVAYGIDLWRMDRKKTFYLEQLDDKHTMDNVRVILALEKMGFDTKVEKWTSVNSG